MVGHAERGAGGVQLADPVLPQPVLRSAARCASEGGMISPSSPSVQVTSVTCAPSAAYLAIVAPVPIDSSSGCACTSSRRRPDDARGSPSEPTGTRIHGMTESFPRQEARTRRFTLGAAAPFRVSPDGARVVFLRSKGGADPVTCLWVLDVATGGSGWSPTARALGAAEEDLPPEEARPARAGRGVAGGIVAYATDAKVTMAVFALSGHVYGDLTGAGLPAPGRSPTRTPALDPHALTPPGTGWPTSATARSGSPVWTPRPAGRPGRGGPGGRGGRDVRPDRVHRRRGDGPPTRLLVVPGRLRPARRAGRRDARDRWHIADPAHPDAQPVRGRLSRRRHAERRRLPPPVRARRRQQPVDTGCRRVPVPGHGALADRAATRWSWSRAGTSGRCACCGVDPGSGRTAGAAQDTDPHWLEIVTGVPAWTADGRIVWTRDDEDTRRLVVAPPGGESRRGHPAGPAGPRGARRGRRRGPVPGVRRTDRDPVWSYGPDGLSRVERGRWHATGGTGAGGTTVVVYHGLDHRRRSCQRVPGRRAWHRDRVVRREPGAAAPRPVLCSAGSREIRTAVLFPSWHEPGRDEAAGARRPVRRPGTRSG